MDAISIIKRRNDFFAQLNLSEATTRNYRLALNSSFLKEMLLKECGGKQLFEITDLEELWKLYSKINLHPKNISNHRSCSAAVMKYIKFLNGGKKYGRRIDYNKSRPRK
jgi:hypothetical protein